MKRNGNRWLALLMVLAMVLALTACGGTSGTTDQNQGAGQQSDAQQQTQEPAGEPSQEDYDGKLVSEGMMPLDYAKNFQIELFQGGYRMITAGTLTDLQYLVVPEGMSVPEDLAENVVVLQQPLTNVYMASTGMVSLTDAIGALDHVKLVATDVDGWYIDNVVAEMNAGNIAFSGHYKEPDYELMAANDIQFHLDTTMIEGCPEVLEKFTELGIPNMVENSSKENRWPVWSG